MENFVSLSRNTHTHADTTDSVCPVVTEKHSWIGLVEVKTERERERERERETGSDGQINELCQTV